MDTVPDIIGSSGLNPIDAGPCAGPASPGGWAFTGWRFRIPSTPGLAARSGFLLVRQVDGSEHALGPEDALVTLLEFGDFGCPHCAAARMPIKSLIERLGSVRLVWRHFFDTELHPGADLAAEASEAAAAQGSFWQMHQALLEHQGAFDRAGLRMTAATLALDLARFDEEMDERRWLEAVTADVADAERRGVAVTPTFFIDDDRIDGPWTQLREAVPAAVEAARRRA